MKFMNRRLFSLLTTIGIASCAWYASAQDFTDAMRYSYLSPQATARSMGFGGALGSIGGDFASLSVNPAGIGIYRSSEFTFTPSIKINGSNGNYLGSSASDNNSRFTFNNVGLVFTSAAKGRRAERRKWKAVSFGLGVNRIADFNRNYTYRGVNNSSSGAEAFSIDANLYPNDIQNLSTLAGLGYQTYLTNFSTTDSLYEPIVPFRSGVNQQRSIKEKGGISDINISLGGNYEDKLMLGATLGIPSLYYNRVTTYTETDISGNPNNDFYNFVYNTSLTTRGSGINLKLGFIYKPTDNFRFGAAIHTPTYFQLKDIFNQNLTTNSEGLAGTVRADAPESYREYNLTTPWRAVLSASYIFGRFGFLTADYEYVDYSSARFGFGAGYEDEENYQNNMIKQTLKAASNVRIGAEGRVTDNFMVRLGFGYYGSPYHDESMMGSRTDVSAGVGFRQAFWYMDLAYVHSMYKMAEHPYELDYAAPVGLIAPTANLNNTINNVALTVGFRF